MIRGIHYFSAEVKPKLMSSQGAALNIVMVCITMIHARQAEIISEMLVGHGEKSSFSLRSYHEPS